jgi:hypothetical protein
MSLFLSSSILSDGTSKSLAVETAAFLIYPTALELKTAVRLFDNLFEPRKVSASGSSILSFFIKAGVFICSYSSYFLIEV